MEDELDADEFKRMIEENCYILTKTIFGTSKELHFDDHAAWVMALFVQLQTAICMLRERGQSEKNIHILVQTLKKDLDFVCR